VSSKPAESLSFSRCFGAICSTERDDSGDIGFRSPARCQLESVVVSLREALAVLDEVRSEVPEGMDLRMVIGFRTNCLLLIAEASAWLGDGESVSQSLTTLRGDLGLAAPRELVGRQVEAALALMQGRYRDAADQLVMLNRKENEGAGKVAAMLIAACLGTGRSAEASKLREWVLSERCQADGGNGPAKRWAEQIGGAR
jgi:hypothetical protein